MEMKNAPQEFSAIMDKHFIKDGYDQMDFGNVAGMLKDVWWSPGIRIGEILQGAKNSALLVGVFTAENEQIGYARVISDKTRFAYIMDVVVDDRYRRQGIGRTMIRYILHHPELKDVYQWLLLPKMRMAYTGKSALLQFPILENGWRLENSGPIDDYCMPCTRPVVLFDARPRLTVGSHGHVARGGSVPKAGEECYRDFYGDTEFI